MSQKKHYLILVLTDHINLFVENIIGKPYGFQGLEKEYTWTKRVNSIHSFLDNPANNSASFLVETIHLISKRFINTCRRNISRARTLNKDSGFSNGSDSCKSSEKSYKFPVEEKCVTYLCLQAFVDTLRPKQTLLKDVIAILITQLKSYGGIAAAVDIADIRKKSHFFRLIKTS